MRWNFEPIHMFSVLQFRDENIVMNRQSKAYRTPMTIGLLRVLCGEADEDTITQYHDDEPCAGNPSASVSATGHGEHLPSSQTTMSAEKPDRHGFVSPAH